MRLSSRLVAVLVLAAFSLFPNGLTAAAAPEVGTFFEPAQPFFQTQVQLTPPPKGELVGGNFVVRGILLPLNSGHVLVFDQELLRVAGLWKMPAPNQPVTATTMAQISYLNPRRKVGGEHPLPTGPLLLTTGMHPGVSSALDALFVDPRTPRSYGDEGRGALPADFARFDGIELAGANAVLNYHVGTTAVKEWHESRDHAPEVQILRHLEITPHSQPLNFVLGVPGLEKVRFAANSADVTIKELNGESIATVAASTQPQRVSFALILNPAATETPIAPTPALPKNPPACAGRARRPRRHSSPRSSKTASFSTRSPRRTKTRGSAACAWPTSAFSPTIARP